MKVLLGTLLLLLSLVPVCNSQITNADIVRLTKLPPEGIILDNGWKFHSGDDSLWAKPDFNDKDWQPINPALDIRHIPQLQKVSIFWLRLKLLVDSTLMDQPLGMTLSQLGASEIYLDNALIYKFGIVSADFDKERTHYLLNRPFTIKLGAKRIQTIAVRYSYGKRNFLIKSEYQNPCLQLMLNNVDITYSNYQRQSQITMFFEMTQRALYLLLSLLCFGLYFTFQPQKAYWYIGMNSLFVFFGGLLSGIIARELHTTSLVNTILFIGFSLNMISSIFCLNGIYLLFNDKKSWLYYGLFSLLFFVMVSFFILYDFSEQLYGFYFLFFTFEFARASLKAIRRNRPGVLFLFIQCLLFFTCIILALIELDYYKSLMWAHIFAFFGVATGPIGWSLFMAGEYARTSIALQKRVIEVEGLSQKAITQEQEKQLILKSQNETLENKVLERTHQLNESLTNLRSTQAQLIQSEKMASLGELTAGIAHEIQNPLNFVNNFSDLNKELIDEVSKANEEGNSMGVKQLLSTLKDNEEKIYHHGKRADLIVKGMLQHSRTSTGQKESIDLNRLVDEYLRIAYQGMRTRDNSFNTKIETHYDQDIKRVNIIPHDIGRVLLNLYNNAFYTVMEKKKQQSEVFEPTLTVSTIKTNEKAEVRVKDNGNGIPKKILDKIFQPFFTTKPTGQGTGLGLSLSYDIVKAHGGEIKVETEEGKYSEFTILLHT